MTWLFVEYISKLAAIQVFNPNSLFPDFNLNTPQSYFPTKTLN